MKEKYSAILIRIRVPRKPRGRQRTRTNADFVVKDKESGSHTLFLTRISILVVSRKKEKGKYGIKAESVLLHQ